MPDTYLTVAVAHITTALTAADVKIAPWHNGVVVNGWDDERDLRVEAWIAHDPDGVHALADVVAANEDGELDYLAEALPVDDVAHIVDVVRSILATTSRWPA